MRISDWSSDVCSSDLLLLVDQDIRILKLDRHLFRVGDEIRRQIAAIELHAFDDIKLEFETLGLFDGDDAFLADLLHRLGDLLADDGVAIDRKSTRLNSRH